jgi:hypothetical protein
MRRRDALTGLALVLVAWIAFFLLITYVSSKLVQLHHDSCRKWIERPYWAFTCPPSTKHGAKRT